MSVITCELCARCVAVIVNGGVAIRDPDEPNAREWREVDNVALRVVATEAMISTMQIRALDGGALLGVLAVTTVEGTRCCLYHVERWTSP